MKTMSFILWKKNETDFLANPGASRAQSFLHKPRNSQVHCGVVQTPGSKNANRNQYFWLVHSARLFQELKLRPKKKKKRQEREVRRAPVSDNTDLAILTHPPPLPPRRKTGKKTQRNNAEPA